MEVEGPVEKTGWAEIVKNVAHIGFVDGPKVILMG